MTKAVPETLPPWKEPQQERSKERVEAILSAARNIIVEQGHLSLQMTEIAAQAGVPIGSVYQYFPTSQALLWRLFDVEMQPVDDGLARALDRAISTDDVLANIEAILLQSFELVRARPCLALIWSAPAYDPVIGWADFRNSMKNAERMGQRVAELATIPVDPEKVRTIALLICHNWGNVMRLCLMSEDETAAVGILSEYSAMIVARLAVLLRSP